MVAPSQKPTDCPGAHDGDSLICQGCYFVSECFKMEVWAGFLALGPEDRKSMTDKIKNGFASSPEIQAEREEAIQAIRAVIGKIEGCLFLIEERLKALEGN